jgi:hypothetical protein
VDGGGEGEFKGQIELGKKNGVAVGLEPIIHASIQADFADARGAAGESVAEMVQPMGMTIMDKPGMQPKGAQHELGMSIGQCCDRRPVRFGRGGNMDQANPGLGSAFENLRAVRVKAGVLQVAVGIHPVQFLSVGRRRRW